MTGPYNINFRSYSYLNNKNNVKVYMRYIIFRGRNEESMLLNHGCDI